MGILEIHSVAVIGLLSQYEKLFQLIHAILIHVVRIASAGSLADKRYVPAYLSFMERHPTADLNVLYHPSARWIRLVRHIVVLVIIRYCGHAMSFID